MKRKKVNYGDLADVLADAASYKQRSNALADLFYMGNAFLRDRGDKMRTCGTLLSIGLDDAAFQIMGANFCRQRLCPFCQSRRAVRLGLRVREIIDDLSAKGFAFLHLVLTVKNCSSDDLAATLGRMNKASSALFKKDALKAFKGILRFTEVTYAPDRGDFHPHFHCLVAVRQSYFKSRFYVSQAELVQLWRDCMRLDYDPCVHVGKADALAAAEICKYCVKPLDVRVKDRAELLEVFEVFDCTLGGRRMMQGYGVLKTAMSTLRNADDLTEDGKSETLDFFGTFGYNFQQGLYIQE